MGRLEDTAKPVSLTAKTFEGLGTNQKKYDAPIYAMSEPPKTEYLDLELLTEDSPKTYAQDTPSLKDIPGSPANLSLTKTEIPKLGTSSGSNPNDILPENLEKTAADPTTGSTVLAEKASQKDYTTKNSTTTASAKSAFATPISATGASAVGMGTTATAPSSANGTTISWVGNYSFNTNSAITLGTAASTPASNTSASAGTQVANGTTAYTSSHPTGSNYTSTVETDAEIEERTLTTQEFIDQFFDLTDEEREKYLGTLTEAEYKQLLKKVQDQYEENINNLGTAITENEARLNPIEDLLSFVSDYYNNYQATYDSYVSEINDLYYRENYEELKRRYGLTDEDLQGDFESILQKAMSSEFVTSNLKILEDVLNEKLQEYTESDEKYQNYDGLTYSELLTIQTELQNERAILDSLLSGQQTTYDTAEYDLLLYMKEYYDFVNQDRSINPDDIEREYAHSEKSWLLS